MGNRSFRHRHTWCFRSGRGWTGLLRWVSAGARFRGHRNRQSAGSLTISGQKRTSRLFFPPSLDQHKPAPLVVSLHPCPALANRDDDYAHFDDRASAGGFISAYPYAPQCWNDGSGHGPRYDDVGFVSGLETVAPVIRSRVRPESQRHSCGINASPAQSPGWTPS